MKNEFSLCLIKSKRKGAKEIRVKRRREGYEGRAVFFDAVRDVGLCRR